MNNEQDVKRFLRSPEGRLRIAAKTSQLVGRTITGLEFEPNEDCIVMGIKLDDGTIEFVDWMHIDEILWLRLRALSVCNPDHKCFLG